MENALYFFNCFTSLPLVVLCEVANSGIYRDTVDNLEMSLLG